jgi:hypothetical protein
LLITGKGFRDTKINEFDRRWIVKCAKEILGLDVTMYNAERVNVLQRCELHMLPLLSIASSQNLHITHCLIHDANDGFHHHSGTIFLLLS